MLLAMLAVARAHGTGEATILIDPSDENASLKFKSNDDDITASLHASSAADGEICDERTLTGTCEESAPSLQLSDINNAEPPEGNMTGSSLEQRKPKAANSANNRIDQLEKMLDTVRAELADAISELSVSVQATKTLEDKIEQMQIDHIKELNETFNELETLSRESEKYKRQLGQNEERCQLTRKQLSERDQELRDMHYHAVNQYVNFTLIGSDLMEIVQDIVSSTKQRVNRKLGLHSHYVNPKIHRAKRQTKSKYGNMKKYVQLKAFSMQRRMNRHWSKSTHIRPLLEDTWGKIGKYTFDVYHPYEPIVNDIRESLHLSSLSAIKVTSRGTLNYLDNHIKRKKDREVHRREHDKEMAQRHGRHHRPSPRRIPKDVKVSASGQVTVEPPYLHKKIRPIAQFMFDNAEGLVAQGSTMLPLFMALYAGGSFFVGSILYFVFGMPNELIWAFALIQFMRKMRQCKA